MLSDLIKRVFGKHSGYHCNVCGDNNAKFIPLSNDYKEKAETFGYKYFGRGETIALETYSCASCNASDRERLYALWIDQKMQSNQFSKKDRLIHFAPEKSLAKNILNKGIFSYESADMMMENVDHQVDLTNLPFANESYDFFICSHVLEHINEDIKAISELYRITKKGGKGILMAPICQDIETTIEDPNITDPAERFQYFGQEDHVRLYSRTDFLNRISSTGFKVEQITINDFDSETFKRLGLSKTSRLYIVEK